MIMAGISKIPCGKTRAMINLELAEKRGESVSPKMYPFKKRLISVGMPRDHPPKSKIKISLVLFSNIIISSGLSILSLKLGGMCGDSTNMCP